MLDSESEMVAAAEGLMDRSTRQRWISDLHSWVPANLGAAKYKMAEIESILRTGDYRFASIITELTSLRDLVRFRA